MSYQVSYTGGTTNATETEIYQADGTRFLIAASASYRIKGTAIAQNTSTIATHEWEFTILVKNVAGVVSLVGLPTITDTSMDSGTEAWILSITVDDTNDAIAVKVTGALATTITWNVGFNYDSIGYTAEVAVASSSLNVPQIVEIVKVHSPKTPNTKIVKMLSTAQKRFIKASKLNIETSVILLTSQTVVGKTNVLPLTLTDTDSTYTWSFFKDTTVGTLTMKANSNVLFYTNLITTDSAGDYNSVYAFSFNQDGTISIFDDDGDALTDFDTEATYLTFEFIKNPTVLSMSSTSTPEIQSDYHEALAYWVISDLYMERSDMQMIERLQASKHFKNLYKEFELRAKFEYRLQNNLIPQTSIQGEDFGED